MKVARFAIGALLVLIAAPSAFAAGPACATFDSGNRPAANFDAGDTIVVRGTGFSPNVLVLVSFQQGTRTAEISHLKTNDLGAFTTDPASSKLPSSVDVGAATVQVFQGSGAATCEIHMVSASAARPGGFGRTFYLTWGIILTLIAIGLGFATVRRFQAERLSNEMDSIEWQPPEELPVLEEPIVVEDDERPVFEEPVYEPSHYEEPAYEPPRFDEPDEPEPEFGQTTSDVVARLRREVRSWRA